MNVEQCELIQAITCHEGNSIQDVARKLREHQIRHLIVVDDKNVPVGVVGSTDITNKIIAEGKEYTGVKVTEIMTAPIFSVKQSDEVTAAYVGMAKKNTFSCPVVGKDRKLIGMLTFTEVMKHLAKAGGQ